MVLQLQFFKNVYIEVQTCPSPSLHQLNYALSSNSLLILRFSFSRALATDLSVLPFLQFVRVHSFINLFVSACTLSLISLLLILKELALSFSILILLPPSFSGFLSLHLANKALYRHRVGVKVGSKLSRANFNTGLDLSKPYINQTTFSRRLCSGRELIEYHRTA